MHEGVLYIKSMYCYVLLCILVYDSMSLVHDSNFINFCQLKIKLLDQPLMTIIIIIIMKINRPLIATPINKLQQERLVSSKRSWRLLVMVSHLV